jgi:hypothetical protein
MRWPSPHRWQHHSDVIDGMLGDTSDDVAKAGHTVKVVELAGNQHQHAEKNSQMPTGNCSGHVFCLCAD